MPKKDESELKKIISYEISKNFKKLEKKILDQIVSDAMSEVIKLSVLEVMSDLETNEEESQDRSHFKEKDLEDSWPFKVYGGRNYVPMSTKQFLNSIKTITERASEDALKDKRPYGGHEDFVEAFNIPNARNAQVFALKQIYDLIRWSNKNDEISGRMGKVGEA